MKKIMLLSLIVLFLTSCNDWLTVTPKGQVEADDLLKDQRGYNSALAGIYTALGKTSLYGGELTYGMMDLLAQYWDISSEVDHTYRDIDKYDFTGNVAQTKINYFWRNLYSAISQCNLILEGLKKNGASIEYSELMEAEALGLRAFCHMELFRLFGPVIHNSADLDKKTVAYRTRFDVKALEFESGKAILEKAKADLLAALELAKDDPIKNLGRKGDGNKSSLNHNATVAYRGERMNYFAILALLARNEQYMLNQDGAYEYAKRILDELEERMVFRLITFSDLNKDVTKRDYIFSQEMIFALYNKKYYEKAAPIFGMDGEQYNSKSGFRINYNQYLNYADLYEEEGSGYDIRLNYWFEGQSGGYDNYDLTKLREGSLSKGMGTTYDPEIPIIRLAEIYYIACEAQIGKDNALAVSYLNTVRQTRRLDDLPQDLSDQALLNSLLLDMRKEFIGEGRMFPTYKRLFYPIYVTTGFKIDPDEYMFILPIPDEEYEYSPNDKPSE